ncbi:hypothetical protein DICVIV_03753 [Dictyocaulus viviparus]|uniref:Uncharacterized protein n=1 Tax=Dictyocaulus viviparus TaxID=29172 RepID=A0A0D8Y698_DICVI|nr:hypothetical protein DICVIV_03753 [Dictyocaulus viviparus]
MNNVERAKSGVQEVLSPVAIFAYAPKKCSFYFDVLYYDVFKKIRAGVCSRYRLLRETLETVRMPPREDSPYTTLGIANNSDEMTIKKALTFNGDRLVAQLNTNS